MPYLTPDPGAPEATETAVIVRVSAAEALVGEHRQRLDVAAGWGVPAHVTLLYPFAPPAEVDDGVLAALATVASSVDAFDCTFTRTRWFGDDVVWLEPEPDAPFRRLTAAIWAAFPQYPPYEGAYEDPIPHLTIGDQWMSDVAGKRIAERAVRPGLPLTTGIDRFQLIAGAPAPNSFRVLEEFVLPGRVWA